MSMSIFFIIGQHVGNLVYLHVGHLVYLHAGHHAQLLTVDSPSIHTESFSIRLGNSHISDAFKAALLSSVKLEMSDIETIDSFEIFTSRQVNQLR